MMRICFFLLDMALPRDKRGCLDIFFCLCKQQHTETLMPYILMSSSACSFFSHVFMEAF